MIFYLDIANPGQPPNRFELPAGVYTVGRGEACKIRLRHADISERHALLFLRETGVVIEDLRSSNGTSINGIPLQEPASVKGDDVIGIGPCLLRVSREDVPEAAVEKEAPPPPAPMSDPAGRDSSPNCPRTLSTIRDGGHLAAGARFHRRSGRGSL